MRKRETKEECMRERGEREEGLKRETEKVEKNSERMKKK